MKLSNRNNALEFLSDHALTPFATSDDNIQVRNAIGFMEHEFPKLRHLLREKIQYISEPFFNAYRKGREKLNKAITEGTIKQQGTFIRPLEGGRTNTIFYRIEANGKGPEWDIKGFILYFMKGKEMPEPYLTFYADFRKPEMDYYLPEESITAGNRPEHFVSELILFLLFMQYCEVETKVVPPGKKAHHVSEKYLNETPQPIEILDSTWFTTIVRSEGFMVGDESGGIFRLQPYGPGRNERKLIWIAPFEKKGYTRKAKVSGKDFN